MVEVEGGWDSTTTIEEIIWKFQFQNFFSGHKTLIVFTKRRKKMLRGILPERRLPSSPLSQKLRKSFSSISSISLLCSIAERKNMWDGYLPSLEMFVFQ
jgi:hypothetical protein